MQSDPDFEHITCSQCDMEKIKDRLHGQYVYIINPDTFIIDNNFIEQFKRLDKKGIEIVVIKGWLGSFELPVKSLLSAMIISNIVIRRDVFENNFYAFMPFKKISDIYKTVFWDRHVFYTESNI